MVIEKAYAKINLALEVMEKENGYHKVNNLMIPINLYDEVILEESDKVEMDDNLIEDNICIKAANIFLKEFNINKGVRITVKKNIPVSAGLAGGSTDAAAVLRGMNKLFNINASCSKLEEIGSQLGSDVPFFINTKFALCTNRGEVINPIEINYEKYKILLLKPKSGLSTKEVYQNYIYKGISKKENIKNIIAALEINNINMLVNNIFNDLALVSISLNEELKEIYTTLNYKNLFVSGSGPTMFIINPSEEQIKEVEKKNIDFTCLTCLK